MIDIMSDFFKRRTTITSQIEGVKELEPPTFTICLDPPFKTSKLLPYDVLYTYNIFHTEWRDENTTLGDLITKASYELDQDIQIKLELIYDSNSYSIPLKTMGAIKVGNKELELLPIQTYAHGTCYKIQPKFKIAIVPFMFYLEFKVSPNLKESDQPSKFIVYLTSHNTWQGITTGSWPQKSPSKVELDFNSGNYYQVESSEHLFNKGVESSEDCWKSYIEKSNCPQKCRFASFVDLPMCISNEEVDCIYDYADKLNLWTRCNLKSEFLTFEGELTKIAKYGNDNNLTFIYINLISLTKEVIEEIRIISFPNLLGSLGGSLGMFFGFSISAYVLFTIDKCIMHLAPSSG